MAKPMIHFLVAGLVSAALPMVAATAQETTSEEQATPPDDVEEFANNSSFVWLEEPDDESELETMSVEEFARQFESSILYDGGFLVHLSPAEARIRVGEVREKLQEEGRALPELRLIEPNALVHGFASGCGDAEAFPATQMAPPPGVERVNGPIAGPFTNRVWIIDSGIAGDFDGTELNVNRSRSRECNQAQCGVAGNPDNTATRDRLGHGTSLAGTIGAMDNNVGIVGVAPGVELIAVQIFRGRRPIVDVATALEAVRYVAGQAQSGDVVNISWGATAEPGPNKWRELDTELKNMAMAGVKIAVAAGNNDVLQGSGYVQTVSPARVGAFRDDDSDGAIITVSAANSQEDAATGDWTDNFWLHSVFGNGEPDASASFYLGPPDFAEPGVGILSLWPATGGGAGRINTCTGTSFATAHMSGILVSGVPQADGAAAEDPSAKDPDTGQFDPARLDRIGVR